MLLPLQFSGEVGGNYKPLQTGLSVFFNLYCCTVHLDINVYAHQLMHLFISLRKH